MKRYLSLATSLAALLSSSAAQARDICPNVSTENPFEKKPLPDIQSDGTTEQAATTTAGPSGERPLRHVWVLDHSGSMYPDYAPGAPRGGKPYYVELPAFRSFVTSELAANFRDGQDSAAIVVFNEKAYGWDGQSARVFDTQPPSFEQLRISTAAELQERFSKLPAPPYGAPVAGLPAPVGGAGDCAVAGAATNCSKMMEGLSAARRLLDADSGEGVIWMVTDNIYEGGRGGAGVAAAETDQNRRFYEAIRATREFRVVVAYPVVRGTSGSWLGGTSLFVYGIYYDKGLSRHTPVDEVRRLLGDGSAGVLASEALTKTMSGYSASGSPSPGRPFRLKPLDQDIVRLTLATDVEQVRRHVEMGQKVPLKARIRVQNMLDHRVIDEVTFQVTNGKWSGYETDKRSTKGDLMSAINAVCPDDFIGEPVTVKAIGPGQSTEIEVPLEMPPVDYTIGSLKDLFQIAMNDDVVMGGSLQAKLTNVKSRMAIDPASTRGTYGADALPQVFENPQVNEYTSQFVAKTRRIENPGTVMALLGVGGLFAAVLLLLGFGFLLKKVSRRLVIDGVDRGALSMNKLTGSRVERNGETFASARLTFGGRPTLRGVGGYTVAGREGDAWVLKNQSGAQVRVALQTIRRR